MKKNYKLPRMRAVEIKESSLLSVSDKPTPMSVELNDYNTYQEPIQGQEAPSNSVDWNGVGTGSDF